MTKRIFALLLVLAMAFSIAACTPNEEESSGTSSVASEDVSSEVESKEESSSSKNSASKAESNKKPTGKTINTSDRVRPTAFKLPSTESQMKGLDFGGKTFQIAITNEQTYHTKSFEDLLRAFEKQYNCKLKVVQYPFFEYNQKLRNAVSGGGKSVPEITFMHGNFYIDALTDNLYQDLTPYLTMDDVMKKNNHAAGGLDPEKTAYFTYNKKIYGICDYESLYPYVMYYNKLQAQAKGYDPRSQANKAGQWTWDKIYQVGSNKAKFTDPSKDTYFLDYHTAGRPITLSYGAPVVKFKNGKYTSNISSKAYKSGLDMIKKLFAGNKRVGDPKEMTTTEGYFEGLLNKDIFLSAEESSKFVNLSQFAEKSATFNKKISNIGVVEMPLGGGNKLYPTGWLTGVTAPKSKDVDPRVAVAFALFRAKYTPARNRYQMAPADEKYVLDLIKGGFVCEPANFKSSDDSTADVQIEAWKIAIKGGDIAKATANDNRINKIIKDATKKLK